MTAPLHPLRWWEWLILVGALALYVGQAQGSSPLKSAAFDEQYHLAAGYSYLRTGDFRLATNHPPLAGMIAALPLLGDASIALPTDHPTWQAGDRFAFSDVFLWEANADPQGLLLRARWPVTLLGVLLVVSICLAARQMLGARAGWLALLLSVFDPNLIAHGRFVTTDLALTLFLFLTVWWAWRWLVRPRWYNLAAAGVFAGLTMATKYNGAIVWPIVVAIALLLPVTAGQSTWKQRLWGVPVMGMVALAVLWALYRFDLGGVSFLPAWVKLPAPFYFQQFWNTFNRIVDLQGARVDFFLGEASNRGWWYYFFVALAVKAPLPTLLLSLAGLAFIVRDRTVRRLAVLWATPALFLILGATQVLNIGFRHMLPAVPFLVLLAAVVAQSWRWLAARSWRMAAAGVLLTLWLVADTVRIAPHYESFFNQLAGPWQNWSNILVDSNLDWGQDLPALRQVMEERGIDTVNLAYFGKAAPEKYGVRYRPLPSYLRFMQGREIDAYNPYTPEPGWYAISATALRTGTMTPETANLYAFFRDREPDARAGYSIYLYQVSYPDEMAVVRPVVVGEPVYRRMPDMLGVAEGVRAQPKWEQSPAYAIYPQGEGFVEPAGELYTPVNANFGDVLTLVGYSRDAAAVAPGGALNLTLYWRVGTRPMPQPAPTRGEALSIFVHAVDGDPAAKVAEFDSWEVAMRGLEAGDVIAQPVTLNFGGDVAPKAYDLLVGAYSPQDWARLTTDTGAGTADFARVGQVEVVSQN